MGLTAPGHAPSGPSGGLQQRTKERSLSGRGESRSGPEEPEGNSSGTRRGMELRGARRSQGTGLKWRETTWLIYEGQRSAVCFLRDSRTTGGRRCGSHYPPDPRLFIPSHSEGSMDSFRDSPRWTKPAINTDSH